MASYQKSGKTAGLFATCLNSPCVTAENNCWIARSCIKRSLRLPHLFLMERKFYHRAHGRNSR